MDSNNAVKSFVEDYREGYIVLTYTRSRLYALGFAVGFISLLYCITPGLLAIIVTAVASKFAFSLWL